MDLWIPSSISFWFDNWLVYAIADRIDIPLNLGNLFNFTVSDYFGNGIWNIETDFYNVYPDIVDDISKHRLFEGAKDVRIWKKLFIEIFLPNSLTLFLGHTILRLIGLPGFGSL